MRKQLFGVVAAAALSLAAGGANAAVVYNLNVDHCTGTCGYSSYGTISVTGQTTNTLTVDIELVSGVIFNEAGGGPSGHDEVWFNSDNSTITLGGLSNPFQANGSQAAGAHNPNGASFGTFDYVVVYKPGSGNPATAAGGVSSLIFTITGTNPLLEPSHVGTNDLFFVVDVAAYSPSGGDPKTGHIGALLDTSINPLGGVPEPATWAMMLVGFGGLGAMLRRRRMLSVA